MRLAFESSRPRQADGPLVSVLVPMLDRAAYIEDCLQSVAGDGHPRLELLVLDGGSKDGSVERAAAWAARHQDRFERIAVWVAEGLGIPASYNRLVAASRGEFLSPLASDDRLAPGALGTRLAALQDAVRMLAVVTDARVIDAEGRPVAESQVRHLSNGRAHRMRTPRGLRREVLARWAICASTFLIRREAFDRERGVGPYPEDSSTEDREFVLALLAKGALLFLPRVTGEYRVHGGNTSGGGGGNVRAKRAVILADRRWAGRFHGAERWLLRWGAEAREAQLERRWGRMVAYGLCHRVVLWYVESVPP